LPERSREAASDGSGPPTGTRVVGFLAGRRPGPSACECQATAVAAIGPLGVTERAGGDPASGWPHSTGTPCARGGLLLGRKVASRWCGPGRVSDISPSSSPRPSGGPGPMPTYAAPKQGPIVAPWCGRSPLLLRLKLHAAAASGFPITWSSTRSEVPACCRRHSPCSNHVAPGVTYGVLPSLRL